MSDRRRTATCNPNAGDPPDARGSSRAAERYATLWESSPDGLILLDEQDTVLEINPAATSQFPFVIGQPFHSYFRDPDAARQALTHEDASLRSGGQSLLDGRMVLLAGGRIRAGDEAGLRLVQVRDASCVQAMEGELEEVRRFALVGQLAASIANAINNPLAVILGRIELFGEIGLPDPASLPAHLAVISEHAQRIAGIVDALLSFSRPAEGSQESIPLVDLMSTARRASGQRTAGMRLDFRIDPALRVVGHRVQLEQVLASMLSYAAEAMHRKGAMSIQASATDDLCVIAFYAYGHAALPPRLREMLENGTLAREAPNSGISLGILSAANLLRQSGGRLSVSGQGMGEPLFKVELPTSAQRTQAGGPRRILSVDSVGTLADELRAAASNLDLVWSQVADTGAALDAIMRGVPDLIVSALELRDGGGLQLRNAVAQRWPGMEKRVVVAVPPDRWALPCVPTLWRPVRAAQLQETLRRVTDAV